MLRLCWASQLHWLQALHRQQMRRQLDVIREAIHANNCSIASSRAYRERIDSDSHLLACQPTEVVNRHVPAYLTEITPGNSADIKNTEQDLSRTWNLTDLTDQKKDVSECFLLVSPDAPPPGGHMGTWWAHGGHPSVRTWGDGTFMPGKPRPAQDSMSCAGRPAGEVTTYSKVVDRHERLRYTLHLHIAEPHLILILSGGFLLTMIEWKATPRCFHA